MIAVALASELVAIVLSAPVEDPRTVIEYAKQQKAVFNPSGKPGGYRDYVMLQLPGETEPAKWGVATFCSSVGRRALARSAT